MPPIHTHDANRPREPEFSVCPRKFLCDVDEHDHCHCQDAVPEPRQTSTTPVQSSNRARKNQRVSITFGGSGSISGSGSGSSCSASTPSSTTSPLFPLLEFYTQSPMCHTASFPFPLKEEQHHPLAPLSPTSPLESSTFGSKDCATLASVQTVEAEGQAQDILASDTSTQDPHNPSRSPAPVRDAHARFTFGYGDNIDALSLGTSLTSRPSQPPLSSLKADFYRSGRCHADLPPLPLSSSVHTPRIQSTTATRVPSAKDGSTQCDHGQLGRQTPSSSSLTQAGPCASAAGEAPNASDNRKTTYARRSSLRLSLSPEIDTTQPTREPRKKRFSCLSNILSTSRVSHTASSADRATILADKPLPPVPSTSFHSSLLSKRRPRAISTSAASALELDHRSSVPDLESSLTAASRRHNTYNNNSNNSAGVALQEKRPSIASLQAIFNGIQVLPPHDLCHLPTSNIQFEGYSTTDVSSSTSPVSTTASTGGSPGRPSAFLGASRDSLVLNTFTSAPPAPVPLRPPPPQLKGPGSYDAAGKSHRKKKKTRCGSWSLFCFRVK